jgi:hypothetical protein
MKRLVQIIKSIKLKQVLSVLLIGSLLVISTACNDGNVAQAGGKTYTDTAKRAGSDTYDDYDANQEFKGGINGYNDDRRYDGGTAAKTKELIDVNERIRKDNDNPGDYLGNVTERALDKNKEATKKIPRALKENFEGAAEEFDYRTDELQKNLDRAPDEAKRLIDETKTPLVDAVKDAAKAVK